MNKHTFMHCVSAAAICYTLLTLALSASFYAIEDFDTAFAPSLGVLTGVLCFSLVYGFSGKLFDIAEWTAAPKRICHFSVNLVAFTVVFTLIMGEFILSQAMVAVFLFLAVYLICVGLSALCRLIVRKYRDFNTK